MATIFGEVVTDKQPNIVGEGGGRLINNLATGMKQKAI